MLGCLIKQLTCSSNDKQQPKFEIRLHRGASILQSQPSIPSSTCRPFAVGSSCHIQCNALRELVLMNVCIHPHGTGSSNGRSVRSIRNPRNLACRPSVNTAMTVTILRFMPSHACPPSAPSVRESDIMFVADAGDMGSPTRAFMLP